MDAEISNLFTLKTNSVRFFHFSCVVLASDMVTCICCVAQCTRWSLWMCLLLVIGDRHWSAVHIRMMLSPHPPSHSHSVSQSGSLTLTTGTRHNDALAPHPFLPLTPSSPCTN